MASMIKPVMKSRWRLKNFRWLLKPRSGSSAAIRKIFNTTLMKWKALRSCNEVEPGWFDFLASAEREKNFRPTFLKGGG